VYNLSVLDNNSYTQRDKIRMQCMRSGNHATMNGHATVVTGPGARLPELPAYTE